MQSAVWLLWVTHPISRASEHWSHPPKSVWQNLTYLASPDIGCSSAVWVMLWTTLASRTCQRMQKRAQKTTLWLFLLCTAGNLAVAIIVEHVDNPDHGFLMHTNKLITLGETNKTNSAWVPRWWNALARDTGQSSHQAAVKISLLSYTPKFYITAQEWRLIIWHAILAIASLVAVVHIETCICI